MFISCYQLLTVKAEKLTPKPKRPLPSRADQLKSLQADAFDIVIIGGGATGAGCALDACTRGKTF